MIETIKFINLPDIYEARTFSKMGKNAALEKYLFENKIEFLEILEFEYDIRIELVARNTPYNDVTYISNEELQKLLSFTGCKTFYFTPINQWEVTEYPETARGIVLVLKK